LKWGIEPDTLPRVARIIIGVVGVSLFSLMVCARLIPRTVSVEQGMRSPRDFVAPYDAEIVDDQATKDSRDSAAAQVQDQYRLDRAGAHDIMVRGIRAVFAAAGDAKAVLAAELVPEEPAEDGATPSDPDALPSAEATEEAFTNRADELIDQAIIDLVEQDINVERPTLQALFDAEPQTRDVLLQDCLYVARTEAFSYQTRGGVEADEAAAESRLAQAAGRYSELRLSQAVADILRCTFTANRTFDLDQTEDERRLAEEVVPDVTIQIRARQLIVAEGDIVDETAWKKLEAIGVLRPSLDYARLLHTIAATLLAGLVFALVISQQAEDVWQDARRLVAFVAIALAGALAANLATGLNVTPESLAIVMGAAQACGIVSLLLFGALPAMLCAGLIAFAAGLIGGNSLESTLAVGVAGGLGVLVASRLTGAPSIAMKLGAALGVANLTVQVVLSGVLHAQPLIAEGAGTLLSAAEWSVGAGIAAVLVGQFVTRVLEGPLEILTDMRLLELSDPRRPVLHETMVEAPGTYHSSLQVANLAGVAAESLGMNDLLVRVGAMYHDIGKLKYPHFFAENQFGGPNPHDKLTPSMSALVLVSHVKEGLERGRKARLPRRILDFIAEHHGTTLIRYFYHAACEAEGEDAVPEERFRYPGPKPRSRETAILMLADSVEAAVRSMKEPTLGSIDSTVRGIVKARVDAEQLSEAPLTLRDIDTMTETLVRTLQGIHHTRIEYPSDAELLRVTGRGRDDDHDGHTDADDARGEQ